LLQQTEWTISEIAFSLGFEELPTFPTFLNPRLILLPLNSVHKMEANDMYFIKNDLGSISEAFTFSE